MTWAVRFSTEFGLWFQGLEKAAQDALAVDMRVLASVGPQLGRPHVDTLKGAHHANLKELRTGTFRSAFAFDLKREAVMLVGGDKKGVASDVFYDDLIKRADEILTTHLARQRAEIERKKQKEQAAQKKQKKPKRRKK